jgi:hypothetical protein
MTEHATQAPGPVAPGTDGVRAVWLSFTESIRPLLSPRAEDRALDQFLALRDKVYVVVASDPFLQQLENALLFVNTPVDSVSESTLTESYLEELRACTRAAEVAQVLDSAGPKEGGENKHAKSLLSKASIALGSIKDVASEHPYAKIGLGLFKELVDFFKG